MKKLTSVIVLAAALVLGLSGCLSTSSTSTGRSSSSSEVTIKMYVNSPEDDIYAEAAVLALKLADSSYSGLVSFSYTGTPSVSNVGPVATYYGYCEGIKTAIAKGHGSKCGLTFNTEANGSGTALDFSSSSAIVKSLLTMALYNYTTVYAIYSY